MNRNSLVLLKPAERGGAYPIAPHLENRSSLSGYNRLL
jgi:hypothetical protein